MVKTIYLHEYVIQILETFGKIDEVINKIVDIAMSGQLDIESAPVAPPQKDCTQCFIDIKNIEYLRLLDIRGHRNNRLSLRRLIYQFVDEEIYNTLGWATENYVPDSSTSKFRTQLARSIDNLIKLYKLCHDETTRQIIKSALSELRKV